ncbi:hypothetical protein DFJ73DRAFT_761079 [Zopfochytrium polystomum]|nr:hypothetical protein DFJ73DRAFT_761079 [Zopfochytrium polystomum]
MTNNKGKQPAEPPYHRLPEASGGSLSSVAPTPATATRQLVHTSTAPPTGPWKHITHLRFCNSWNPDASVNRSRGAQQYNCAVSPASLQCSPHSLYGANLTFTPVRFTHAKVHQQLQQQGVIANNCAVNQQYYSLQQRAAEYACVATEIRLCAALVPIKSQLLPLPLRQLCLSQQLRPLSSLLLSQQQ